MKDLVFTKPFLAPTFNEGSNMFHRKPFLTYIACLFLSLSASLQRAYAIDLSPEPTTHNTDTYQSFFKHDEDESLSSLPWTKSLWRDYGDFTQYGLPLLAFAISHAQNDPHGANHLLKSCATSIGTVHLLKHAFNYTVLGARPDGGVSSFPSGHTIGAVCGSAYLQSRYGVDYGAPSLMMAGYVAGSRVYRDHEDDTSPHHVRDVMASFIIGYAIAEWMVPKHSSYKATSGIAYAFNARTTPLFEYSRTFKGYGPSHYDPFDMTLEITKENYGSKSDTALKVSFSYSFK